MHLFANFSSDINYLSYHQILWHYIQAWFHRASLNSVVSYLSTLIHWTFYAPAAIQHGNCFRKHPHLTVVARQNPPWRLWMGCLIWLKGYFHKWTTIKASLLIWIRRWHQRNKNWMHSLEKGSSFRSIFICFPTHSYQLLLKQSCWLVYQDAQDSNRELELRLFETLIASKEESSLFQNSLQSLQTGKNSNCLAFSIIYMVVLI